MESVGRIHNFGAGPAVLPIEVVEEVAATLPNLLDSGFGLLEVSHRSATFQSVIDSAMERIRRVLSVPDDYEVLFLQGGASTQFYMTALNLIGEGEKADFLVTGGWSQKALREAGRVGDAAAAWDDSANGFRSVPQDGDYSIREDAAYVHYTSNNTLYGTQYHHLPDSGGKPRVVDASSDICGVPIDVSAHDVIYAGAQKNLGASGVTLVIISPWALSRGKEGLPTMLDYNTHVSKGSMFNTPNTSGIYILDRVFAWIERNGGLEGAIERNRAKAALLYGELDRSDFWRPHAHGGSRSVMNVTWRLADEALESVFLAEAEAARMGGLKGHRSVGGIRASMYNGCSMESVKALVGFMRDFESPHG
ncbi:3-phosphoserine/phosphohydroxythreonine transaminase [Candidatus Thalassarchaeum betae]|uniref:3-phosphoserine/phosphohydroxythreonine transaminase n=1 Tax=Candidatus Thalassarchaeum betae TaxID=2599289 RepID=UPI0030C78064|nr:3-phosphoserine/phosphohydroxythreonine transaminase [Candidatus Thalassoarchaea betae]